MTRHASHSIRLAAAAAVCCTSPHLFAGDEPCDISSNGKVYGDYPNNSDGPEPGARFGQAVAIDSGVAVIGAFLDDSGGQNVGRIAMYRFDGNTWNIETAATPQPSTQDGFSGNAVDISDSGRVAIVGGQFSNASGQPASGAAWVFRYVPADGWWVQEDILLPSDPQSNDLFGFSVSSAGTWAVIGAPQSLNGGPGKAYVFIGPGAWNQTYELNAPDAANGDNFGIAVAQSNDVIVIGADNDDDMGTDSGSVYVYRASGGAPALEAKLTAPDGYAGQVFGHAVDVHNDTILVGAHGGGAGRVYVFRDDGSNWNLEATLTPPDGSPIDLFGWNVSLDGDNALVTSVLDDHSGQADAGSAYLYQREGAAWSFCSKITADDAAANDTFGRSAALSGSHIIVGADLDDDWGADSGSAYLYEFDGQPASQCPPSTGSFTASSFGLVGGANGTPWAWEIRFSDPSLPPLRDLNVPGVAPGGTAFDVAQAFRDSIEAARDARGCTQEQFIVDVRNDFGPVLMTIAARGGVTAELFVGAAGTDPDCEVSFLLPACSFNPTIENLLVDTSDCNANGWSDLFDILSGASLDNNSNGIPDECENCGLADIAAPFGVLDLADVNLFVSGFVSQDAASDLNADGLFDLTDVNLFVSAFMAGCP